MSSLLNRLCPVFLRDEDVIYFWILGFVGFEQRVDAAGQSISIIDEVFSFCSNLISRFNSKLSKEMQLQIRNIFRGLFWTNRFRVFSPGSTDRPVRIGSRLSVGPGRPRFGNFRDKPVCVRGSLFRVSNWCLELAWDRDLFYFLEFSHN